MLEITNNKKLTEKEIANQKADKVMQGVAYWSAFYRYNPHRFCIDYLNITGLKLFQKILLFAMMHNHYFMYCASRGQGKTWLTALFCVVRCILFPGTKIAIASGTRSQATEVINKILDDFCKSNDWGSDNLNNEISYKSNGVNNARIEFKNGSWIKVVTASDSGRGARANILLVDEFRMVDLDVINTVLRKFLSAPRSPRYLENPKYSHLKERNKEIYMSSVWYMSHWSFTKAKSYVVNSLDDTKKYFICGLPYQVSLKEGLLFREQIEDEMSEMDFDEVKFSMEMGAIWFGDTDGAFFTYDNISKCRRLKYSVYPKLSKNIDKKYKIPDLSLNERRILSVDIALMASKKKNNNDASAITINCALPNSNNSYIANIVYVETFEGLTTDELALIVRRLYDQYKCTDLVVDTNGVGLGVYDSLIKDIYDPELGITYEALSCCNDEEMAARCKVKNAKKVIWSVKATEAFNSQMYLLLRSGFQNHRINLLASEFEAEETLKEKYKIYTKLTIQEQLDLKMPYVQTTLLLNELIHLQHKVVGNKVKISEQSGSRKDRVSSLGYNMYVMDLLEKRIQNTVQTIDVSKLTRLARKPNLYSKRY